MANVVYLVSPWRFLMFTLLKEYVTAVSIIAPKEIAKMWQKEACREPWNNNNGLRDPIPSFQGAMHVMKVSTQVFATSPLQPWQIPLVWFSCLRHTYCEAGDGFRMNPGWFNRNVVHWLLLWARARLILSWTKFQSLRGRGWCQHHVCATKSTGQLTHQIWDVSALPPDSSLCIHSTHLLFITLHSANTLPVAPCVLIVMGCVSSAQVLILSSLGLMFS